MSHTRPNILHLFTDMQRADTIHALGNVTIKTPHLDRLVSEGTAFTNAFAPSPVCVAARCSMIHGQYPMHTGCYENTPMPTDDRQTFMGALTEAGYRTHGIGKCHFSPDAFAMRGFQTREIQEEGGGQPADLSRMDYLSYLRANGFEYISEPYGVRSEMYYIPQLAQLPAEHHPTAWVGARSRAFIEERAGGGSGATPDEPWYLYSSFIHPHPPFAVPSPWHKIYRTADMDEPIMPHDVESMMMFVNRVQNRYKYRDQGVDMNLVRTIRAYYYACISFIDYQIGQIIEALERTGQLDNTLILFASDHGEYLGDYGCWGKRAMHDASARVPLIVRYPERFAAGAVVDTPASLVDLAPTFLAAAGDGAGVATHELDGVDLDDLAAGRNTRDVVFSQLASRMGSGMLSETSKAAIAHISDPREIVSANSMYMAVSRDGKYVYSAPDARQYYFDRVRDPHETRNRFGAPFFGEAAERLKTRLIDHLVAGGETAGLTSDRKDFVTFPRQELSSNPDHGLLVQDMYTPWTKIELPGYIDT